MQPSRRQFITGAMALGATKVLAQDEEKLPHMLDLATEQKRWEDLLASEKARMEMERDEERVLEKEKWEADRRDSLERYQLCTNLERILLSRFLAPMDEWLNLSLFLKEPEMRKERVFDDPDFKGESIWLLLKIRSADPLKGKDIWMKFSIGREDIQKIPVDNGHDPETGKLRTRLIDEPFIDTLWRKRDRLLEALEHHLVLLLQEADEEEKASLVKTIVDGSAHLYRIIGPDSPPDKVTKEQMLR